MTRLEKKTTDKKVCGDENRERWIIQNSLYEFSRRINETKIPSGWIRVVHNTSKIKD